MRIIASKLPLSARAGRENRYVELGESWFTQPLDGSSGFVWRGACVFLSSLDKVASLRPSLAASICINFQTGWEGSA